MVNFPPWPSFCSFTFVPRSSLNCSSIFLFPGQLAGFGVRSFALCVDGCGSDFLTLRLFIIILLNKSCCSLISSTISNNLAWLSLIFPSDTVSWISVGKFKSRIELVTASRLLPTLTATSLGQAEQILKLCVSPGDFNRI